MWSEYELEQVRLHELWLEADPDGIQLDWTGKVFPQVPIPIFDLRYAILDYAKINGKHNLSHASLIEADLTDYNGGEINWANLTRSKIGPLSCRHYQYCDMTDVNFSEGSLLYIFKCTFKPVPNNNKYTESFFDNSTVYLNPNDRYHDCDFSNNKIQGDLDGGELIRCDLLNFHTSGFIYSNGKEIFYNDFNIKLKNSKISGSKFKNAVLDLDDTLSRDIETEDCLIKGNAEIEGRFTRTEFDNVGGTIVGEGSGLFVHDIDFTKNPFSVNLLNSTVQNCVFPQGKWKYALDGCYVIKSTLNKVTFPPVKNLKIWGGLSDCVFPNLESSKFNSSPSFPSGYFTTGSYTTGGNFVFGGTGNSFVGYDITGSGEARGSFLNCIVRGAAGDFQESRVDFYNGSGTFNLCEIYPSGTNWIEATSCVFPSGLTGFNSVSGIFNTFKGKITGTLISRSQNSSYYGCEIEADTADSDFSDLDLRFAKLTGVHSNSKFEGARLEGAAYKIEPAPNNQYKGIYS